MTDKWINLTPAEPKGETWGGWPKAAWKENSTALVAYGNGGGLVLEYEGPHLDYEICEVGQGWGTGDLMGDPPSEDPHLWIWEGKLVNTTSHYLEGADEYDSELSGDWRPLTDEEWAKFRKGEDVLPPSKHRPRYPEDEETP